MRRTQANLGEYFPSKRDLWLGLLIWVPLAVVFPLLLVSPPGERLLTLVLMVAVYGFVAWIWFATGYWINQSRIVVRSGPLRWTVKLADVTRIRETRNPLSSAALSLDRLEIRYARFNMIFISPLDKERFLSVMQERCPEAEIIRRKA